MDTTVDDLATLEQLGSIGSTRCEDALAPIPGERWTCAITTEHGPGEHMAEDGTQW